MPPSDDKKQTLNDLRALAEAMDARFRLPGGFRIGWDGILGFIPGLGDLFTNFVSGYILLRAALAGVAPSVLIRMGLNVLIDNIIDVIPVFGSFFDIFWKANLRNIRLYESYVGDARHTRRASLLWNLVIVAVILAVLIGSLVLVVIAVRWGRHLLNAAFGPKGLLGRQLF